MNKNFLTRMISFVLAAMMILTSLPINTFAEPVANGNQTDSKFEIKYDNGSIVRKEDYINETKNLPVVPKKTDNAGSLIKNPDMPKLYTVHSDFKVQRGDDLVVSYQPYIATAGAAISQDEKDKINKEVKFPNLDGYTSATPNRKANITYDFIEKRALAHKNLVGDEYKGHHDYIYTPITSKVKVKHLFQDINDFNKYDKKLGEENKDYKITTQQGVTGTSLTIQPLPYNEIIGYVPESTNITTQVPENTDNFVIELRYNLAHYTINYDTAGGTEIPARTLYYGQVIPKIADADIPTKVGGDFLGWKPSVKLTTKSGKEYKENEIIKVATGGAIKNLDANLIMPAEDVTFTAVWKDKEKADYAVQFWAEKADHADGAPLADKYDYIGTRVYKDQDTGSRPDLDNEPVKDIVFPDLDQARLAKIWAGARFNRGKDLYLNKFYVYNKDLTHEENKDPANVNLVKSVDSTGKTVYNIYYDRQVYDLYFTKSNAQPAANTFYPEIWGYDEAKGEVVKKGGPGNPYHYKARFNQLMLGWPNDAMQTKGFSKGMQSFGWGPNYNTPNWPGYLDTPPYRLNADEFLDMPNYIRWGGYTKKIDKGDGTNINVDKFDFTTLSFGINQAENSMPHHMDFWMDGFKDGETIIRYDLYRYKADTNSESYRPKYPKVQGFTGKGDKEPEEFLDTDGIDDKNEERKEVTPFPDKKYTVLGEELPLGKMKFIKAFFNNADDWGDPIDSDYTFDKNGYLRFKYTRNKYPLRFNNDPSKIKGDSEFNKTNSIDTFYEFPLKALSPDADTEESYNTENPKNILDNPEKLKELELTDLVEKGADGKLRVKRPEGLSDQMVFKGWALDPAGTKLIWENPGEKMPNHPVNLYAKWGEPDYKWKVTFDPNGGVLGNIKEENLTQKRKTIQEGDIGKEEKNTYAKKEANEGDKQVFTVIQRQKLVEPKFKPTRKGYDFMGWEVIHYKRDAKTGDYTNEQDTSYRDTYKVPELYSFGNDVVSPVYLKAIWVKSDVVDIESHHHFLDNNYEEVKQDIQPLRDRRVGSYLATVGSRQNAERILVPKDEWDKLEEKNTTKLKDSMTYKQYRALDEEHPRVNSYSQQIRIEPEEIPDPNDNTKLIPNPKAKLNQFHFYYRPFRHREYKVNYLDERGRAEVEKFIEQSKKDFAAIKNHSNLTDAQKSEEYIKLLNNSRAAFKAISDKYSIINQEVVKNGKRHFDARNYRPIDGWVLNDKPQQQLFFDIDEETNAFFGINETGLDEINFFYKDVRVIEVKKDDPVPKGYVRVTFKAADGGSFTDKDGKAVKELYYDVIKGLKSDFIPVPKVLEEGKEKEKGKYYITPDNGKRFIEWDKQKLLNDNTIIEQDYTFTAQYDWSDLHASSKELVKTEAFNDPNNTWTNSFAPTIDELKKQVVKTDANGNEVALPADATVTIVDDEGNKLTQDAIYKKVKEMSALDTNELVRTVVFKAKVTFTGNQADKTLDIPVKIYKNVYEALTNGDMPKVLKDATAPGGDLEKITGDYVKVTVQPTNKTSNKDAKIYYVNPKAWVEIKEVDISADAPNLGFTKWTADKAKQNEDGKANGEFDFSKRHMFTEDTVITPNFSDDVKEQIGPDKPDVPGNFVKVIVDKTANAELGVDEKQTQTFWVNPTKEVTIPVAKPNGKTIAPAAGAQAKAWIFKDWTSAEATSRTWTDTIKAQFTEDVTTITANYKEAENIIKYDPEEPEKRPDGYVRVKFEADEGLTLSNVKYYYVKKNSGVKLSDLTHPTVDAKTGYEFNKWNKEDTTEIGDADITVTAQANKLKNVIEDDGKPGTKPAGYVDVVFVIKDGDEAKGSLIGVAKFFVKPNEYVMINPPTPAPKTGFEFGAWDNDATIPTEYKDPVTTITASFNELDAVSTVPKPGYVKVEFTIEGNNGSIETGQTSIYYVDPNRAVTLNPPTTKANIGYVFEKWDQDTTTAKPYTTPTTVKGTFKKLDDIIPSKDNTVDPNAKPEGYVTVTFTKGDHGSSISGETVYYVNPTANKTLADITPKPTVIPDTGYAVKGWDKEDDFKITQDTTVNAKYDDFDNVIPKYQDDGTTENTKPAGYIEVTFDPTNKAKDSTQKIVYVRPNTAVILKGYEPKVEAKDNYEFSDWNVDLTKKTEYENGTIITALYNDKGDIKTSKEPGYVKVEFKTDDRGKLVNNQGILVDTTELWIAPNKEITIPDPSVIPNAGHTFTVWDKPLTVTLTKNQEPYIINAQYSDDKNIILKTKEDDSEKPKGYVTVTFRADDHGSLEGDKKVITYFVNPDANIMIVDTVTKPDEEIAVPMTKPDANYANDKWYESIDKTNPIKTDLEYVARFNKGKVTLTYNAGKGTGTPPIPGIVDNGTKVRLAPATGLSKADAKFAGWKIGEKTYQVGEEVELTENTIATAQWTDDKQIIEYDPVKDPTTRPDTSYVRVTFEADNGLGLTNVKYYYVKKNAGKTIGELTKPGYTEETGYKFDKWDPADTTTIADKDIVVTAKATKLDNVIPEKDSNNQANKKPDGYKEVTFVVKTGDETKGSIEGVTKFYVNPNEYVTINNTPKANANTGFEFGAWDKDATRPTVYDKDTTIIGSFNDLKNVIPKTKTDESEKPKGYVTVTFAIDPATGGQIVNGETTVYYVKPNTDATVPQPKTIAETGYEFEKWNQDTTTAKKYTQDTTVKGNFKKLEDIIPSTKDDGKPNAKPGGYITVTFDKGEHGSLTGQTVYYVNPKADPAKTIGQITKPTVKVEVGYKFTGWDKADTEPISENLDIVVKAQYTALLDVIVKTADDDSQKPDGYITVTFDTTNKGRIKYISMITKKVLFVNPNKAIVLNDKAPGVVPKKGYEFSRWDVSIDKAIQYENGTTITALYNEPGNISTTEVAGYVKVVFKPGTNGSLEGQTTEYWIKPGVQVNIPEPKVDPNVGFKFKKWDMSLTVTAAANDPTYVITATYEELPDIIPQVNKDGSDKPKGYVKVTFKGEHGTLVEPTIYYVNPNKEIWLYDSDFTKMVNDKNADIGYTSVGGEWDVDTRVTIIEDKTITYTFKKLDDVIEKTSDNQVPPKGYVKVTLNPTDKAKDEPKENKENKVYFVNPLKNVTLPEFEPTGKEETINDIKYTYEFKAWASISGVVGAWPKGNGKIEKKFTQDTDIKARYTKKVDLETLLPAPVAKENVSTPINVKPDPQDLIKNVYDSKDPNNEANLPEETKFEYITEPDVKQAGDTTAKVKVTYPNGKTVEVEVPIKVVESVIPQIGNDKPKNVPSTFVKVTFDPTDKGTLEGAKIFWVDPTKEVIIPVKNAVGNSYNVFAGWKIGDESYKPDEKHQFKADTTVTASYTDSENIIPFDPKAEPPKARPEGYVKVTFDAQVGLKLRESKAYYVKKGAKDSEGKPLTLKAIKDAGYPTYDSANGYQFSKWDKADTTVIGTEDIVVTALAKQVSSPVKPGDDSGYRPSYPEIIYRDKIVEKEKIVEKVVEKTHNIYGEMDKELRYMQGFNGKFRPYDGLTRAEAAQILANALKADGYGYDANYALSYNDVGDMWYTDAIRVVTQANVFQGYSDGTFKPQSKITRAEWVATLRRFQSLKEANGNAMMLKSGHWAIAEVEAAYEAGWLGVYQEGIAKFDADKPITRQEVAYVSNRAFRRVLDKIYLRRSAHTLITYKDVSPSMPLYEDILCASNTLLTDGKYYRANTVDNNVNKFNIVTDGIKIDGKKFQFIIGR